MKRSQRALAVPLLDVWVDGSLTPGNGIVEDSKIVDGRSLTFSKEKEGKRWFDEVLRAGDPPKIAILPSRIPSTFVCEDRHHSLPHRVALTADRNRLLVDRGHILDLGRLVVVLPARYCCL